MRIIPGQIVANYGKLNAQKIPYFFVMKDNNGTIIPVGSNVSSSIGNSDTSKWFGVHLINKILSVDMTMWAALKSSIFPRFACGGLNGKSN